MDLAKIVAKKYILVRRFQSISSRIELSENNKCLQAIREIKELRTLGPYTSRSVYGGLLSTEFSKFFFYVRAFKCYTCNKFFYLVVFLKF